MVRAAQEGCMSRKIQCITMTLFLSALMAASVQAAPTRPPVQKPTPVVGIFSDVWRLLSNWVRGHPLSPPSGISIPDSSQLDPNGGH
jgi:hypothetical protein